MERTEYGRWFRVRAPGTSANLGPGFDALGLALEWCESLDCALAPSGLVVRVEGEGRQQVPRDGTNLVVRAARAVFAEAGLPDLGLRLRLRLNLPVGRGLGSSAAAVAAGLVGANALLDQVLGADCLVTLGAGLEGHPDNIAPALLGGFCASCATPGGVLTVRLPVPPQLAVVAAVPDSPLPTHLARAALPAQVPFGDAVFNVQRACLLVAAVASGRLDALAEATGDRLHQGYRAHLVPGLEAALAGARAAGALGAFLSGAGPTVLALVPRRGPVGPAVAAALEQALGQAGGGIVRRLALRAAGAVARPIPPPGRA